MICMALIIIQSRFIESPAKIPTIRFADTAATSEYAKASDNIINAFESFEESNYGGTAAIRGTLGFIEL
jgi:hypothetical protein